MEKINQQQYQALIKGALLLEEDAFGVKVLDTRQGEIIKLFRRKRFFSTALLKPYAVRFVDNAQQLDALGIPTVKINRLLWCHSIKRHLVVYQRLDGLLLRDVLSDSTLNSDALFRQFGSFIAKLHNKGVYFRSAHLKNILVCPNGEFALIDISDMQIKKKALKLALRIRNFQHILRYQTDKDLLKKHTEPFFSAYLEASPLNKNDAAALNRSLQSNLSNTPAT